jgi:alpha-glucosidase (family GH31 glycosyl hydrolase)
MGKVRKVSQKPVKYIIGDNNNYRVTVYSTSLLRLEYSKKGVFDDDAPIIMQPELNEEVEHTAKWEGKFFVLKTEDCELKVLPDGRQLDVGNVYFTVFETFCGKNVVWQPGIVDKENIGGAMLDLFKFPDGKSKERFSEGLISRSGYFIFRNYYELLWDTKTGWVKRRSDWEFQDWFMFGYGKNYKKAFADFIKLFGRIPLIPKWAFGYWYSKWYKFKDTDILEMIKKFKELSIPIDVFIIDTDWRKHGWDGYEWNREFFPDYKKFLHEVKKQNVHIGLNDHPGYDVPARLHPDDPYLDRIKSRIPGMQEYYCNWTDKKYVDAWVEEIFTKFLDDGVDFWWVDGNVGNIENAGFPSQQWVNRFYFEAAKNANDNRRPMILSRWGGVGAHKYPVQFSGDTYSTFETLKYQISYTHKGGNVGAAYWSHDIGGFFGTSVPEDLYIRWVQFGCFSPIFRTHSIGAPREPWEYSTRAVDVFRKYVRIRYALFPYFYAFARECFEKGLPVVRGLYIEYPEDKNSYLFEEEYLIGDAILVVPAYGPGEVFEREAYFPKGLWVSLEDKEIIRGPCKKKLKIPLERIPIYIKLGAVIPTCTVRDNLSYPISEIELNIYPSGRTELTYYEDDGITQQYLKGEFIKQKILIRKTEKEIYIELSPIEGKYDNCLEKITCNLNILAYRLSPKKVFVDVNEKEVDFTDKIFSQTVKPAFNFLRIELKNYNRREKKIIKVKT